MSAGDSVQRIVLAFSGGLDTSVILKWLQVEYASQVVAFIADVGQGEELQPAKERAEQLGASEVIVEDLRERFAAEYVWPMFRANALYEGGYLLGTSIARPLIAAAQVEAAARCRADALAHGATGKGNDQVRFELAYRSLAPQLRIIAPWREWDLNSRARLLEFGREHGVPMPPARADGSAPYSMDANLLHISYEGGELEDPAVAPANSMWLRTVDATAAPDQPEELALEFAGGDLIAIAGERAGAAELLAKLNEIAGRHGIGRVDLVESRFVGMKSRGCYETPGGTVLLAARRALESLTLDREVIRLREDLMPRYATLVYNGLWFSPERELLQKLFDQSQLFVNGKVTVRLYKGSITILSRASDDSLYSSRLSTFEDDSGAYDQNDAGGFIKLNALRLQLSRLRDQRQAGKDE
ncbi:MAG: argininosuccinate synthase [Betaproteobacteria bacterium]|nr:argininosuccinate synthase [Betaproteobacteria bacterium]